MLIVDFFRSPSAAAFIIAFIGSKISSGRIDKYLKMYLIVDTTNYIPGFIMATIQIRVDDNMKSAADTLFSNLGLDTSTAIRMFLSAALAKDGMPFAVRRRKPNADLLEAIHDTRNRRNLHGPYKTSEEAVAAMLKD